MTWPHSPEKILEPNWPLSISEPYDANDGPKSSIYYRASHWERTRTSTIGSSTATTSSQLSVVIRLIGKASPSLYRTPTW